MCGKVDIITRQYTVKVNVIVSILQTDIFIFQTTSINYRKARGDCVTGV